MNTISEYRGYNSAALMIHLALFAYQRSYGEMVGTASDAILRFAIPSLSEMISLAGLPDIGKEKSLEDNMNIYLSMVKEIGYVVDARFSQKSDNEFVFEMNQCHFAFKGHRIFNEGRLICPFAILAATVLFVKTGSSISLEPTKFYETGSITKISLKPGL